MTARELFEFMGQILPAEAEQYFGRRDLCIFTTRVAVEVGRYFGIEVKPVSVRLMLFNAQFAKHIEEGDCDVKKWWPVDGSHSVGIGYGAVNPKGWTHHLIAVSGGIFGDFSIGQGERPEKGITTGPSLIGPFRGEDCWTLVNQQDGTVARYQLDPNDSYLQAPDWKDETRRKAIAGKVIRAIRARTMRTVA